MVKETSVMRGEHTRQAILDAAERLFLAQGYNGSSMRQIAQEAGSIAVGGIYNHFSNKEELFRALLENRSPYPELIPIFESLTGADGPALLRQAFISIQAIMRRHIGFIRLAMIDLQESDGNTLRSVAREVVPHALKFMMRAQAAGGIRKKVNVFTLARAFVSMMMGYFITGLVAYKGDRPLLPGFPQMADAVWQPAIIDILLYGLASDKEQ